MKILHVQKIAGLAGSESHIIDLLTELKSRKVEVELLCLYDKDNLDEARSVTNQLAAKGINIHFIQTNSIASWYYLRSIAQLIKKNEYSLIHTHLLYADIVIGLARYLNRVITPQISTKHGFDEEYINEHGFNHQHVGLSKYRLSAWFAEKFISKSIAVSEGLRQLFIGLGITKPEGIITVHHGITKKATSNNDILYDIIVPGRLVKFKGHRYLINALELLKEQYPNLKVKFAGRGPLEDQLKEEVLRAGLSEMIEFMGFRNDVFDLMTKSRMTIVPSSAEGFGLVILEAFCANSPVLTFDVPACNEIITNNKNGLLAKPFDAEQLAGNIKMILEMPDLRTSLTQNASKRLDSYFSVSRMTDETLDVYRSLLALK